ncbi:hypothetical protein JCM19235_1950 [Vibrio maritimus]|uniref:Phage protein n=1 Tax=Vibrio maritimus TaxID=990268 RepID=A0A090SGE1_9VIBR|nr:hypothetical protein JCM19235_1950 [Vibrio maritimus]
MQEVKTHLNLDSADTSEDGYLTILLHAALLQVSNDTNRTLYPEGQTPDTTKVNPIVITKALVVAALLLVAHWYENREAVVVGVSVTNTPYAYTMLIGSHRVYQSGVI